MNHGRGRKRECAQGVPSANISVSPSLQAPGARGRKNPGHLGSLNKPKTSPRGAAPAAAERAGAAPPIKLEFTIEGPLMGYRKDVAYSHSPEYKAYKRYIKWLAFGAGIQRLPKEISTAIPQLSVFIRWRHRARIDWDNVVKAVQDALWQNDRDVDPGSFAVFRDTGKPEEAMVVVSWYV